MGVLNPSAVKRSSAEFESYGALTGWGCGVVRKVPACQSEGCRGVGQPVKGAGYGGRAARRGAGRAGRAPLTFAGLVSRDVLGPQPLVQDVKHLPAQVQEEQR